MERAEWPKQMRNKAEELYDHLSPQYSVTFGLSANDTHREHLQKFLGRVPPRSTLLSAACGAGRYDGILLEAGHSVVGIDQSAGMLARARERFPEVQYEKLSLQEIDFQEAFDGVICMDAMEHICPEDWQGILRRFQEALKPGGVLYFTVDLAEGDDVTEAYERAKGLGLPVVFGEVVDKVEQAYERTVLSYTRRQRGVIPRLLLPATCRLPHMPIYGRSQPVPARRGSPCRGTHTPSRTVRPLGLSLAGDLCLGYVPPGCGDSGLQLAVGLRSGWREQRHHYERPGGRMGDPCGRSVQAGNVAPVAKQVAVLPA